MSTPISKETDDFIIRVFKEESANSNNRQKWFRKITMRLSEHSFNDIPATYSLRENGSVSLSLTNSKEISLSNFSIMQVDSLFILAIRQLVKEPQHWSHPCVLYMLNNLSHLKTKTYSETDKNLWADIKFYCNVVYSYLNMGGGDANEDLRVLLGDTLQNSMFRDIKYLIHSEVSTILDSIIKEHQLEAFVGGIYLDHVLLKCRLDSVNKIAKGPYQNFINFIDNNTVLNEICRKLFINIVA